MELIEVPQLIRNADRFREVVTVLARHGLADWMSGVSLPWLDRLRGNGDLETLATPQRIRIAMTELGTTFIKLGQVLSTRPDLVGAELADELAQLRANTPGDESDAVVSLVESELGGKLSELFATFDRAPIASASIGQVHCATLHDGQDVVVKVQHTGIEQRIINDLEIMVKLAEIAEEQSSRLRQYRPVQTVQEFQKTLMRELDFGRELRNMNRFRKNFLDETDVRFATPFPDLSSRRVLTMERLIGVSVSDKPELVASGVNLNEVARRGATVFLDMIFRDGFYHADPHPGNLMVCLEDMPLGYASQGISTTGNQLELHQVPPDNEDDCERCWQVGLLDCGMVGRIDDHFRDDLERVLIAAVNRDADSITEVVARLGKVPSDFDSPALVAEIQDLINEYADQTLQDFNLGMAISDVVGIIREHHIYLPSNVAMLLKVIGMLEGTAHQLNPRFSLAELIEPYGKQAMLRRFSPKQMAGRIRSRVDDWDHLLQILPKDVADILHSFKQGNFDVHLQHRRLEPVVNRLVMGILTAALFVGSASLWSNQVEPKLLGVSVFGFLGCATAIAMGTRIMLAIRRSRRSADD